MTYTERAHSLGGVQRLYDFPNGYGASAICTPFSYGGKQGLWEVAVRGIPDGHLCYATPITDDVEGHLTEAARDALLERIAALIPPSEPCDCNAKREESRANLRKWAEEQGAR